MRDKHRGKENRRERRKARLEKVGMWECGKVRRTEKIIGPLSHRFIEPLNH
jgi:hypothetical protein